MKVFISQPMKGLSEKEIKSNREKAIKNIKNLYGDDAEIIDSYIDSDGTPLWCLGKSIELLSTADIAYFVKTGILHEDAESNICVPIIMELAHILRRNNHGIYIKNQYCE